LIVLVIVHVSTEIDDESEKRFQFYSVYRLTARSETE
jgi:hypothetical protein